MEKSLIVALLMLGASCQHKKENTDTGLESISYTRLAPIFKVAPILNVGNELLDTNTLYNHFNIQLETKIADSIGVKIEESKYQKELFSDKDGVFLSLEYFKDNRLLIVKDEYNSTIDTLDSVLLDSPSDTIKINFYSMRFKSYFILPISPVYGSYIINFDSSSADILLHKYRYAEIE